MGGKPKPGPPADGRLRGNKPTPPPAKAPKATPPPAKPPQKKGGK